MNTARADKNPLQLTSRFGKHAKTLGSEKVAKPETISAKNSVRLPIASEARGAKFTL